MALQRNVPTMPGNMETVLLAHILAAGKAGIIKLDLLERVASELGIQAPDLLNDLATCIAHEYSQKKLSFDDADAIMNAAFSASTSPEFLAAYERAIPSAMYEVYLAFDAGEFRRPTDSDSTDPEIKYTKPLIAKFLASGTEDAA